MEQEGQSEYRLGPQSGLITVRGDGPFFLSRKSAAMRTYTHNAPTHAHAHAHAHAQTHE